MFYTLITISIAKRRKMGDERVSYMRQRDPSVDRRYRPRPNNVRDLFKEITEDNESFEETTSSLVSGSSQMSLETENTASVFLRLRPLQKPCKNYDVQNNTLKVHGVECATTNNKDLKEKHFEFTNIFDNGATQKEIYDNCVKLSIDNEESLTILTYGTSGSGKTFTMYGTENDAGIIQRAFVHIFTKYNNVICTVPGLKLDKCNIAFVHEDNFNDENQLREKYMREYKNSKQDEIMSVKIQNEQCFQQQQFGMIGQNVFLWMSFVEIYNENVYDLLNLTAAKRKNLKVIANDGNSFVKDLTSVNVHSLDHALAVMRYGLDQVKYASTNINKNSSRSHCILIMNVIHYTAPDGYATTTYRFCDLAGSERLKKTENTGDRLKEAQRINTSLLVLGRCLDLLYHNQQLKTKEIVPFRESKLTLLLQRTLIGREKIATIVNMMPTVEFIEENLHVLNFSSIASKIIFKVPKLVQPKRRTSRFSWFLPNAVGGRNEDDWNNLVSDHSRLEEEIFSMRDENEKLHEHNEKLLEHMQQMNTDFNRKEQALRKQLVDEREEQVKSIMASYEKRLEFVEKRSKDRVS